MDKKLKIENYLKMKNDVVFKAFWEFCNPDAPIYKLPKPLAMVLPPYMLLFCVKTAAAKQITCIAGVLIIVGGLRCLSHTLKQCKVKLHHL